MLLTKCKVQGELSFSYELAENVVDVEEIKQDGKLVGLKMIPVAEGTASLTLKATDDSNETASFEQDYAVQVTDRNSITLKYVIEVAIGLVALIIVVLFLKEMLRPKFKKGDKLAVEMNGFAQKEYPLGKSIKHELLFRFTPATPQDFMVNRVSMRNLEIRPHKQGMLVIMKKSIPDITVKVGMTTLKKKGAKAVLNQNSGKLTASKDGSEISWRLTRHR